jgi:hypothetical protein
VSSGRVRRTCSLYPRENATFVSFCCQPSILFTQAIERKRVILCCFHAPHVGMRPQDAFARVAVLHGNMYLVPLMNWLQCCSPVAVRLLYEQTLYSRKTRLSFPSLDFAKTDVMFAMTSARTETIFRLTCAGYVRHSLTESLFGDSFRALPRLFFRTDSLCSQYSS